MSPRRHGPTGPFARFAHLLSAAATAGRKPRLTRSLAAHRALRLESLESRAMLSSAPFIAELPQDLAGKTASLITVHGRYGNNALNGDWELGLTSNTSAPPQHQINRTWTSGTSEPFTFSFTNTRPDTFTNSLNATFSIGGSGVQFDYGSQFASYEPNAIKIWARTATATSGLTINDLRITTPGVTGKTVFPGASIAVSQASGTVFQEIIIAGIDFPSLSGGTVTLEGNATMQFGTDPALRGSALQFHVIATHIPWVDLDVDSNNIGGIDDRNGRSGTDDRIEQAAPGKIIPVGGDRAEMLVTLPAGRTATLEVKPDATDKLKFYTQREGGEPLAFHTFGPNDEPAFDMSLVPGRQRVGATDSWTLWVEATGPSTTAGDLVFTLTGDQYGPPARDIVRATAVTVDLDVDSNNDGRIDPDNGPAGTDDPIEESPLGRIIFVNSDDDNRNGIADLLDGGGIAGEDDLGEVLLALTPSIGPAVGTLIVTYDETVVRLYKRPDRSGGIVSGGPIPADAPVYAEGRIAGTSLVTVTWTVGGLRASDTIRLTVQPYPATIDVDVDSDNSGSIARSLFEDSIEDDPTRPGVIVPVGGAQAQMIVDVPAGRTATLAFDAAAASKVRVLSPSGAVALEQGRLSTTLSGGAAQTFRIEAFAPSTTMADIAFTLTLDVSTGSGSTGSPPSDKIRATAVDNAVSIKAIDDVAHERYGDSGTFVITRESGRLDTIIPVQIIVSGDAGYGWQYQLTPDLPPLPVGGNDHYSTINLMPGVDRLIVTLTPLREDRDNRIRKAVIELVAPQIPLYAVTRGYDKAEVAIIPDPQQGDLQITGTITYEAVTGTVGGNTLTLGALPVRGAKVEIRDQGINGDTLLATAYTDDSGKYAVWISSDDPTPGGGYVDPFVIVVAQSAPQNIAVIAHEVSISSESLPARKVFADQVVPRGPGRAVLDGALSNSDITVERRLNAAFSVFDAIYSFSRYHVTLPGVTPATVKARVREANGQDDTSQYSRSGEIEILLRDRFSWDTIGHEYGHFAHEHAGVQLGRGEHYPSENLRFSRYGAAWRLAFTEGFATYFSIVAQSRTPKPPSGVAGYGDTAYWSVRELDVISSTDIEAEGPSMPAGAGAKFGSLGEDNEVSVFRTLWDLYDPANDDPIGDIGDIGVWKLIATGRATSAPYFKALYQDLITNASVERKWDIGRVLAEHKIVPAPLRVDLRGATTALESLDNPPTFTISALYGSAHSQAPDQWLFNSVQIRFYNSIGLSIEVRGSTEIVIPAGLPPEVSWTPTQDQWADIVLGSAFEPIRWSVVATTELSSNGISSAYESFSETVTLP